MRWINFSKSKSGKAIKDSIWLTINKMRETVSSELVDVAEEVRLADRDRVDQRGEFRVADRRPLEHRHVVVGRTVAPHPRKRGPQRRGSEPPPRRNRRTAASPGGTDITEIRRLVRRYTPPADDAARDGGRS